MARLACGAAALLLLTSTAAPAAQKQLADGTLAIAGYVGCRDWDTLTKILDYSRAGDEVAAKKLLMSAAMLGECTLFHAGQKVYVTDAGGFTHSIKVRPAGSTLEFWTTAPNGPLPMLAYPDPLYLVE